MGKAKLALLAVVCVMFLAPAALAEPWGGFPWWGYGAYWGPYGWWYPYSYQYERIPYFALFPPVYYSYPVSRPYGQSPFNYGYDSYACNGAGSAEGELAGPLTISNPYLRRMAADQATPVPQQGGALRIDNPYVAKGSVQGEKAKSASTADQTAHLVIVSPP
jgi:hypothetical protein